MERPATAPTTGSGAALARSTEKKHGINNAGFKRRGWFGIMISVRRGRRSPAEV
jgi:hypothetical protein